MPTCFDSRVRVTNADNPALGKTDANQCHIEASGQAFKLRNVVGPF